MIRALVRQWPRLGSGAQGHPRNLDEPNNGGEAMKGAFGKRGQGARADALSPSGPDPAAHAGCCSARRRKGLSAMRQAGSRLGRAGRATHMAHLVCRGGFPVRTGP
jgi:hypothetical protein